MLEEKQKSILNTISFHFDNDHNPVDFNQETMKFKKLLKKWNKSYKKFKNNSYCIGGRLYSATENIEADIT